MIGRDPSKRRRRKLLVQLEILALALFNLSLVFLGCLALIGTVPVAHLGGWLDAPSTPEEQWVLTTEGFLRFSSFFAVPALGLSFLSIGVYLFVARPLARRARDDV